MFFGHQGSSLYDLFVVFIYVGGFGVEVMKCFGGPGADVGAGYLWLVIAPRYYHGTDTARGVIGVPIRALYACTGSVNASVELTGIKCFARALAATLDYIDCERHLVAPACRRDCDDLVYIHISTQH
jgi:hypothetical protein